MSVIFLMLKKSANRRQREQLEAAFEVYFFKKKEKFNFNYIL